jgi:3D-(3,5/4)-trihydroxycyclohexane-1,2-dione acylhydrolase (decyclizing)
MSKYLQLTTGQAVAKFLENQYSKRDTIVQRIFPYAFGIFGHGNLSGLGQGFNEYGKKTKFFQPFHEQSMVHSAVGFSRIKRRLATFACTASIGPGTTNLITGAAGATIQRVPVLLLPSDHYATRRQGVVLQQLEHPTNFDMGVTEGLRNVSVFFDRITRPEQIIPSLLEATRVLMSPSETGAATIAICQDVQGESFNYPESFFKKRIWSVERKNPDQNDIEELVNLFLQSSKPVIISGGGVYYSEAEFEIKTFAEKHNIPIVETVAGRTTINFDSKINFGGLGIAGNSSANEIMTSADFVLAIGTRMTDVTTCSQTLFDNNNIKFATINITGRDSIKQGAFPIVADAKAAINALILNKKIEKYETDISWMNYCNKTKEEWINNKNQSILESSKKTFSQAEALQTINKNILQNSYTVAAAGSLPGDLHKLWDSDGNKLLHLEFGYSCMTYEIAAGIGIGLSQEVNKTYVCVGDGTLLMNPSELINAVRENINITIFVFVNHGYQIIRLLQDATTGNGFATEFKSRNDKDLYDGKYLQIDYVNLLKSLGIKSFLANNNNELKNVIEETNKFDGPSAVSVYVDPYELSISAKQGFWDIAPPSTSKLNSVNIIRAEYEKMLKKHKYHL